jgi:hypothetical protein
MTRRNDFRIGIMGNKLPDGSIRLTFAGWERQTLADGAIVGASSIRCDKVFPDVASLLEWVESKARAMSGANEMGR